MNIFKSDKAPYIFGLLLTILGWHVSQFVREITGTQAVSYSVTIDPQTHEVVAEIRNVSRTKSLTNATFSLTCRRAAHCLVPIETPEPGIPPEYGAIRTYPPNAVQPTTVTNQPHGVSFRSTIAAGGVYAIVARAATADAPIDFYYLPDADRPLDIFIYRRSTVTGFLVENYLRVLVGSFVLCLIATLLSIWYSIKLAISDAASPPAAEAGKDSGKVGEKAKPLVSISRMRFWRRKK